MFFSDPAVKHALSVRRAVQQEDYHSFFKLFKTVPNMGAFILAPVLDATRLNALQRICKSYKPSVEADFVWRQLGFEDVESGTDFLRKVGCCICDGPSDGAINSALIDTQKTVVDASAVLTQDKLLL